MAIKIIDGDGNTAYLESEGAGSLADPAKIVGANADLVGALTETAPAADTNSSGLNGRLQRVAQRITAMIALLPTSLGQKTKAASLAVTLASDSDALAVTLSGGATAANQSTANTALADLLTELQSKADLAETQPVSAAALPLPAGASTAANQAAGNATLTAIDGRVDGLEASTTSIDTKTPALGQALAAASVPVVLPATQITTLTPPAAITGFAMAAKQPALGVAGTASTDVITVQGIASGVAQPISGTVAVTGVATETTLAAINTKTPALGAANASASTPVTLANDGVAATLLGAVTETAPAADTNSSGLNGRLQRIAQRITSLIALLPTSLGQKAMTASLAVVIASDQASIPVASTLQAGTNNIGDVDVLTIPDVRESWRVSTLSFTTADDSDNTFTTPANTEYQILSVYVSLATTATAGNRQMAVQALDASDNILIGVRARVTQAASLTRMYNFAPSLPSDTAFYDTDYLAISMPPIFLTAGQKLRVWDKAAIAAAADDMVVRVQIASRSIA